MPARAVPERFLVAISYAGEQFDLVRPLAERLEYRLGESAVFFDKWYEHYIAGHDADLKLQEIYGRRCALALVCVSAEYGRKGWTRTEHEVIRARLLEARRGGHEQDLLAILPIRVGDGDVDGIPANAILKDARQMGAEALAQLVVDRLALLEPVRQPAADAAGAAAAADGWPEQCAALTWPVADHRQVREAFGALLTRDTRHRILLIRGPSEVGKSYLLRQMEGNVLPWPGVALGRLDFKGTTQIDEAVRIFVQALEVGAPAPDPRLPAALSRILDQLKNRQRPTLLLLDTYEAAGPDARDWVRQQLLPTVVRAPWLRVVIAGQQVPEVTGATWASAAAPLLELKAPAADDWFEWCRTYRPEVTADEVEVVCRVAASRPGLLAALLGPAG